MRFSRVRNLFPAFLGRVLVASECRDILITGTCSSQGSKAESNTKHKTI